MKFGVCIEVDEWCTMVCSMTRFKVKVEVTASVKFQNCTFPTLSPRPFIVVAGKWPLILKLEDNIYICSGRISEIFLVIVSRDLELGGVPAVNPSKQSFSDFNEIWSVDRGWWVMHDRMPYDLIQGQIKVTSNWKPLKRSRLSVPHGSKFLVVVVIILLIIIQNLLVSICFKSKVDIWCHEQSRNYCQSFRVEFDLWVGSNYCVSLSYPVYTIQPVVKRVVQPVRQLAVSCKQTSNWLSNRLNVCLHDTTLNRQPAVLCKQTSNWLTHRFDNRVERTATVRSTGCQTGLYNWFDNRLYRVNGFSQFCL